MNKVGSSPYDSGARIIRTPTLCGLVIGSEFLLSPSEPANGSTGMDVNQERLKEAVATGAAKVSCCSKWEEEEEEEAKQPKNASWAMWL